MYVSAIVLSAGKGLRFSRPNSLTVRGGIPTRKSKMVESGNSRVPKPLVKINSQPIIIYCLKIISKHPSIRDIVVVVNAQIRDKIIKAIKRYRISKIIQVVRGGRRRQDSVHHGLGAIDERTDLVLIHDGVRPFITKGIITSVIKKAKDTGAAIVGVPVKATIKEIAYRKSHIAKLIAQDAKATYEVVSAVRKVTRKTLITKLSPNVTDITEIALAAEGAGSDAVSLVNTLSGMSIDINARKPKIASITGGLSGPAIRPIAVRMVWEVYQKIKIPVIGMGGIMDTSSALEFLIAGASAIAIGTANFVNPKVTIEIIEGIKNYMIRNKIKDLSSLIGSLKI